MASFLLHTLREAWIQDPWIAGLNLAATLILVSLSLPLVLCIYRLFLHPLKGVPGPWLAGCSTLWLAWHTFLGDECTAIRKLHQVYGPILRVGPNDIDISDLDAVGPVYVERGGFQKTANYNMFDVDGHATLFSSRTREERLPRVKAIAPLFATASIRKASHDSEGDNKELGSVVDRFAVCLEREADRSRSTGRPVNVLNLARSMALDAVSTYLFQLPYGALVETDDSPQEDSDNEKHSVMSASPFVDAFVGVGAFFNIHVWIPGWDTRVMEWIDRFTGTMTTDSTSDSMKKIDEYTARLVETAVPGSGSYMSRLLAVPERSKSATLTPDTWRKQVQAECKDVCFAGTDSSGMNLAMLLWQLASHPEVYCRLRRELHDMVSIQNDVDVTTNSYLRAVVRESLRLSWANPIRLPRSVPEKGWSFKGHFFPAGTSVGVASFELHQDETIFPRPDEFIPDRWLQPTDEMLTSFFAFGKGGRACIGQNLGMAELHMATARIVQSNVLHGAKPIQERIAILEWFNSRVVGEEILLRWF